MIDANYSSKTIVYETITSFARPFFAETLYRCCISVWHVSFVAFVIFIIKMPEFFSRHFFLEVNHLTANYLIGTVNKN